MILIGPFVEYLTELAGDSGRTNFEMHVSN